MCRVVADTLPLLSLKLLAVDEGSVGHLIHLHDNFMHSFPTKGFWSLFRRPILGGHFPLVRQVVGRGYSCGGGKW